MPKVRRKATPPVPDVRSLPGLVLVIRELLLTPRSTPARIRATIPSLLKMHLDNLRATLHDYIKRGEQCKLPIDDDFLKALITLKPLQQEVLRVLYCLVYVDLSMPIKFIEGNVIDFVSQIIVSDAPQPIKAEASRFFMSLSKSCELPQLVKHGALPLLATLLEGDDSERQVLVLSYLVDFFSKIDNKPTLIEYVTILQNAGLFHNLCALLKSDVLSLTERVIEYLEMLLSTVKLKEPLGAEEMALLLPHLKRPNIRIVNQLCVIFTHCIPHKPCQTYLIKADILPMLSALLNSTYEQDDSLFTRESLVKCLLILAKSEPSAFTTEFKIGLIPLLIREINFPTDLQLDAARLLRLLMTDTTMVRKIHEEGGVPKLLTLVASEENIIVYEGLETLLQMMEYGLRMKTNDEGLLHILPFVSDDKPKKVRMAAVQFLIYYKSLPILDGLKDRGGIPLLLECLTSDSKLSVIENSLNYLQNFVADDCPTATDNAATMIAFDGLRAICALSKHEKAFIKCQSTILMTHILHKLPATPLSPDAEFLGELLKLVRHEDKKIEQKARMTLLLMSRQIEHATALVNAGGLFFLFESLAVSEYRRHAAIALVNISASGPIAFFMNSADQLRAILEVSRHESPKINKRAVHALANLAAHPAQAALIHEAGGVAVLTEISTHPEMGAYARMALKCLAHETPTVSSPEDSVASPVEMELTKARKKKKSKSLQKQRKLTQKINELTTNIRKHSVNPVIDKPNFSRPF
ncbi:MAG: hypothetical protein NTW94_02545 [Legionellales bacterium]|nr:hypothetical protein [Legionellales bacterium]